MARPAPGADRSVAVLELLAGNPDDRFTLSEVARRCDLNKATAHALLCALSARGVLLRHPQDKRYSLGPRLVAIGDAARRGYTPVDFAPPAVRELAASTGLVTRAWKVTDDVIQCAYEGHPAAVGVSERPGAALRLPLVPPFGTVFMAWEDAPSVEAWLARAGAVEVVRPAIDALEAIRRTGVAVTLVSPEWRALADPGGAPPRSVDQPGGARTSARRRELLQAVGQQDLIVVELEPARRYAAVEVAAPVFDVSGRPALALSVGTAPGDLRSGDELGALAKVVAGAAAELTSTVCGRSPA